MIEIKNLTKCFDEKTVLDNLNIEIPDGKCTVIMGPSGCGKTTILNILLGLDKDYTGKVSGIPEKKSAAFQEYRLCNDYTALSNVQMVTDKQTAKDLLTEFGLQNELKKPVREFSGGMKCRVAIARAICAKYELLILDEPFGGLDTKTKADVMQTVKKRTLGKTVIMVTHDKKEAEFMADKIIELQ